MNKMNKNASAGNNYVRGIAAGVVSRWFIDPVFNSWGTNISLIVWKNADLNPSHNLIKIAFIIFESFLSGLIAGIIVKRNGWIIGLVVAVMPLIFVLILVIMETLMGHDRAMAHVIEQANQALAQQSWIMLWLPLIPASLGGLAGNKLMRRKP
jgi:hypothetical protein